jgi:hypothetical protein
MLHPAPWRIVSVGSGVNGEPNRNAVLLKIFGVTEDEGAGPHGNEILDPYCLVSEIDTPRLRVVPLRFLRSSFSVIGGHNPMSALCCTENREF